MKVLVTGIGGKLAAYYIDFLLARNHDVVGLSTGRSRRHSIKTYEVSYEDREQLSDIFIQERPEAVVHMAAVTGAECDKNPEIATRVNVGITSLLAEVAVENGVSQFIFSSTAAVYNQDDHIPTDETHNLSPNSVYGKTKLAAENVLIEKSKSSSTHFAILRIFNLYGPTFKDSLINKLVESSTGEGYAVDLVGYDNYIRDYVHVGDVVDAIDACMNTVVTNKLDIYNIGSGVATSNAALVRNLKKRGIEPRVNIIGDITSYSCADIRHAQEKFAFSPALGIITAN